MEIENNQPPKQTSSKIPNENIDSNDPIITTLVILVKEQNVRQCKQFLSMH